VGAILVDKTVLAEVKDLILKGASAAVWCRQLHSICCSYLLQTSGIRVTPLTKVTGHRMKIYIEAVLHMHHGMFSKVPFQFLYSLLLL